jgi:hypothetical protein
MNNTNLGKTQSLENILTSYNLLILFIVLFIVLMILMITQNKKGFNAAFGYQVFITAPILLLFAFFIREIFQLQLDPKDSWFSSFPQSTEPWFMPLATLGIIIIGIIGFFMMLYVGGIFSDNPPENNSAMILNFIIIFVFILVASLIYKPSKEKDDNIIKTFPKYVQDAYALRTKYTIVLAAFIIFTTLLYFFNPFGLMTTYGGPVVFFTLFVSMVCATFIIVYQKYLANTAEIGRMNEVPTGLQFMIKGVYILVALFVSGLLLFGALSMMGVFEQDASKPQSWGHIIFHLLMFSAMLGILYKLANAGGFLDRNPLYRLILNTLLYIPCLLVSITNKIGQLLGISSLSVSGVTGKKETGSPFAPPTPFEKRMLIMGLTLTGGYFLWFFFLKSFMVSTYLKQGGQQLINQPVPTDVLSSIASYQTLSGSEQFDYRYALSFWFYLDSFPPSTNSSYLKVVPLLSYGDNPAIKYSSETNTLFVTVKQKEANEISGQNKLDGPKETMETKDYNTTKNPLIKEGFNMETAKLWKENITDAIENVKSMTFGNEYDADGNRILYKHSNVLLQKWNHIVINYNGGTLDVFYNGRLVKSAIEVVPYMKYDNLTVGSENGVKGNVANLMYFKMPLDILTINTLYTSLKDKNPPCISGNEKTFIPPSA